MSPHLTKLHRGRRSKLHSNQHPAVEPHGLLAHGRLRRPVRSCTRRRVSFLMTHWMIHERVLNRAPTNRRRARLTNLSCNVGHRDLCGYFLLCCGRSLPPHGRAFGRCIASGPLRFRALFRDVATGSLLIGLRLSPSPILWNELFWGSREKEPHTTADAE